MSKRIWLSSPTMHGDEQEYVNEAFESNWIAPLGPHVSSFEKEMAAYIGIGHAAALSSGSAALHLAVKLAGIKPGEKVFCSDMTFSATVNPVSYEQGVQVFIDSERDTWNMDPVALKLAFKKYPECRVVIVANLYGTPAKLDEIRAICDEHQAILIEDAAESLGSTYKGQQTGTFGHYNVISFNGNKIITTSGGGMLLSDDEAAVAKARFWATQARDPAPYYLHSELGYNYRMSNVLAAIGRGQLKWLDRHQEKKADIYRVYQEGLRGLPLSMNPYLEESEPNFWLSCILLDKPCAVSPEDIRLALEEKNIESRPIWNPMHLQPFYQFCDFITADGNNGAGEDVGRDVFNRGLCLPSDIKMTEEEQQKVMDIIREVVV